MPGYQWNAIDYAKNSSQQQKWARELLGKLNLRGDENLLDLGCGDGKITAEIAQRLPRGAVLGIDLSPEMVRLAQETFSPAKYPNLRFEQANASELTFHEAFEVVFSNAVLHWIRDHRPVLLGICTALKPGGKVLMQMGGTGNNADMFVTINEQIGSPRWLRYFEGFGMPYHFYGIEEYSVWLREAELAPLRVELFPKDMTHLGREGLLGWVRTTTMPYTERLPEELRGEFLDELLDNYLALFPPDEAGIVHVGMVRLEVEAIKLPR